MRFLSWIKDVPPPHDPAAIEKRYREFLKARGFSDADIAAQLKSIDEQEARDEVDRWNRILTAEKPVFNQKPNSFLVEMAKGRKPGAVLDVGMGQGRNA